MSINKVTGFRDCDFCEYTIQNRYYYQYGDIHCHNKKGCLEKIKKIRDKFEFKKVQPFQRSGKRYAKRGKRVKPDIVLS